MLAQNTNETAGILFSSDSGIEAQCATADTPLESCEGGWQNHLSRMSGEERDFSVLIGTAGKNNILWNRINDAFPLVDSVTRLNRSSLGQMFAVTARVKSLPEKSFLLLPGTRFLRERGTETWSIVGVEQELGECFEPQSVYVIYIYANKKRWLGTPQQAFLTRSTKQIFEHYVAIGSNIGEWITGEDWTLTGEKSLSLAKSLFQFAADSGLTIAKWWEERMRSVRTLKSRFGVLPFRSGRVLLFSARKRALLVEGFENLHIGKGSLLSTATDNFCKVVSGEYHALKAIRPFRRSQIQQERWTQLCDLLDVDAIELAKPFVVFKHGMVLAGGSSTRFVIKWEGGGRHYISRAEAPEPFFELPGGARFRAVVEFSSLTHRVIRICSFEAIDESTSRAQAALKWREMKVFSDNQKYE